MNEVRPPQRGDVLQMHEYYGLHWYVVMTGRRISATGQVRPDGGRLEYAQVDGRTGSYPFSPDNYIDAASEWDSWCYADPNREDHADIPPEIWVLRQRVLNGEIP